MKIMVVDDSNTIRKSAEMFLGRAGFSVVSVEDGLEFLTKVEAENPQIIFLDVIMPKIDGLQACQIIRRNQKFQETPIIILSSKSTEFDKARGMMMGATDYLTKPFTKEEIIAIAEKHSKK